MICIMATPKTICVGCGCLKRIDEFNLVKNTRQVLSILPEVKKL